MPAREAQETMLRAYLIYRRHEQRRTYIQFRMSTTRNTRELNVASQKSGPCQTSEIRTA